MEDERHGRHRGGDAERAEGGVAAERQEGHSPGAGERRQQHGRCGARPQDEQREPGDERRLDGAGR
ncbi:hypothetical protein [Streptomyces caatingaensis]|uniref:hypothetical protein n=1 Tax=Streptomyces caatingaensis TaxID=1678637 RepID=UPI0012FF4ABF|nr:hypothetical protein [Streptomyces caatingaensis]